MINFLFGLDIVDTQSGFKCFKRDAIKNLNLISKKYEIETEIIIKSKKNKLKILEVPVFRYERKYGESKLFDIPFGRLIFMLKVLKVIFYGYFENDFWKNKKVLVTGVDGFIASHLTERLIDIGARVSVIIRGTSKNGTNKNTFQNIDNNYIKKKKDYFMWYIIFG